MTISHTLSAIKNLKISGSENIARAALLTIKQQINDSKVQSPFELLDRLQESRRKLVVANPQESCMRHALTYVFYHLQDGDILSVTHELLNRIDSILAFLSRCDEHIADHTQDIIRNGSIVATHSYSGTVLHALKRAHEKGIQFSVLVTEARPYYLGRNMAEELAHYGIPVTLYVDSHGHRALQDADCFLFGCDAITDDKCVGAEGLEMMSLLAAHNRVPSYCLTSSWKFDPTNSSERASEMERNPDDVWDAAPPGVEIHNTFYESVSHELLTSIVSELGIHNHDAFVRSCVKKYPWLKLSKK